MTPSTDSLTSLLRSACAWDERASYPARDRITARSVEKIAGDIDAIARDLEIDRDKAELMLLMGYNIAWSNSARYENARLAPLIERLIAVAEAASNTYHGVQQKEGCAICDALAALRAEVGK